MTDPDCRRYALERKVSESDDMLTHEEVDSFAMLQALSSMGNVWLEEIKPDAISGIELRWTKKVQAILPIN